jgi:hypothetical protein
MNTTVQISHALLADIHKIDVKRKTTLNALVDEGLRYVVETESAAKTSFKMKDASVCKPGDLWPLDGKSWEELRDLIYGDRG